jgi:hypothetical protein
MSKKPAPDRISLEFDLHDLPTAQHRAGLAGLILQIDSMDERGNSRHPKLIPAIEEVTATSAKITFTRDSMQGIFDDLYAAKLVEIVVPTKWPGKTKPKPGEHFLSKKDPKTGEMKQSRGFAYDVVQPQAPCLSRHLDGGFDSPWHDLWRQMVWSIPRGGNNVRSRAPFIDRANERPCGEGATAWAQVVDLEEKTARSRFPTAPISGALMLGAQAVNAEAVPFEGRVDHNLLLHFWQVVVLTFAPQVVNKKDAKVERIGYVLAIPDIADLREFREHFPEILQELPASERGRTPAAARIDLPEQGGLEVLWWMKGSGKKSEAGDGTGGAPEQPGKFEGRLHRRDRVDRSGAIRNLAASKASRGWNGCVRAVETYHMFKLGNNVKLVSFSRLADRPGLAEDYQDIAEKYRNPLFRAALMRALIRDQSWIVGMIELFAEYPWPFFIEGDQTPKYLPRFGRDARERFQSFHGSMSGMEIDKMDEEEKVKHLSLVVQRIINAYVEWRAEKKTGIKISGLKKEPARNKQGNPLKKKNGEVLMLPVYPKEFREAQQRVCTDAFLSMRSRHDQDFVEYFAGSICQADHQLSQANYQFLVGVLMTNPDPNPVGRKRLCWEDIKAIAMIAVSACSFNVRPRDLESQGSPS